MSPAPVEVEEPERDRALRVEGGWSRQEWRTAPRPPATRGDCAAIERPCPALRCRHHLPAVALEHGYSCVLDWIDANPDGATLQEVADLHGVVRERVRQIEAAALVKLQTKRKRIT